MTSVKHIRDRAREILQDLGIENPPVPVREVIEAHVLQIEEFDGPESYDGELIPQLRVVRINTRQPTTRQRFTLAHELGHWVLYHRDRLHELADDDADSSSLEIEDLGYDEEDPFDDEDWVPDPNMEDFWADPVDLGPSRTERDKEADVFAAELLMPTRWVTVHWKELGPDVSTLSRLYGVSEQAMWIKVESTGLLKK